MAIPIANISAVVAGAIDAARAVATEMLPAAVTRDAAVEAARASAAWLVAHLWAWLAAARAAAADSLPTGAAAAAAAAEAARTVAGSAAEASGPWVHAAARLLRGAYGWLAAAAVEKLPNVAAERFVGGAVEWLARGRVAAACAALALLAVAFLGGAACALTCRTMKGPGLGGARVPRAVFEASPKRYYAAVRSARKARRAAGGAGAGCGRLLQAGLVVALLAYLAGKVLH
ncbi:hypothetical protein PAHAL_9G431300 [Panicum hallii]|jgi:hypothetical protein|uniref:Uncharacterized protein n=1 Tax=Panicum hallii TaxID=206008 RepID=A0A2S3IPT4_9POAL|nr:uncharacterized protein LOC112873614 [Panicum hallii]PAN49170.1 hypothetical protein PAHAL_9G431300 [Panicum hallii]